MMNDRDPTMREMFNYDRTKYEINLWPLLILVVVVLWVAIWNAAVWLAPRLI